MKKLFACGTILLIMSISVFLHAGDCPKTVKNGQFPAGGCIYKAYDTRFENLTIELTGDAFVTMDNPHKRPESCVPSYYYSYNECSLTDKPEFDTTCGYHHLVNQYFLDKESYRMLHPFTEWDQNSIYFCNTDITLTKAEQTGIKMTNFAEITLDVECAVDSLIMRIKKGELEGEFGDLSYFDMSEVRPVPVLVSTGPDNSCSYCTSEQWSGLDIGYLETATEKTIGPFKPWEKRLPMDKMRLSVPEKLPSYFAPIKAAKEIHCNLAKDASGQCSSLSENGITNVIKVYPENGLYKYQNIKAKDIKAETGVFYYAIQNKVTDEEIKEYYESVLVDLKNDIKGDTSTIEALNIKIVRIIPHSPAPTTTYEPNISCSVNEKTYTSGDAVVAKIADVTMNCKIALEDGWMFEEGWGPPTEDEPWSDANISLYGDFDDADGDETILEKWFDIPADSSKFEYKVTVPADKIKTGVPLLFVSAQSVHIKKDFTSVSKFVQWGLDVTFIEDGYFICDGGKYDLSCNCNGNDIWDTASGTCIPNCGTEASWNGSECECSTKGFEYNSSSSKCFDPAVCDNIKNGAKYDKETDQCTCMEAHMAVKGSECACDAAKNWASDGKGGCKCAEGYVVDTATWMCVPKDGSPECSSDSDCDDDEICGDGKCKSKEPQPFKGECESNGDCAEGMICSAENKCVCDIDNHWYINNDKDGCEYRESEALEANCKMLDGEYLEGSCIYNKTQAACLKSDGKWEDDLCWHDMDGDGTWTPDADLPQNNANRSGCGCNVNDTGLPQNMASILPYLLTIGIPLSFPRKRESR